MNNVFLADPLSELKSKAKDFISIEDTLNIICEMLDCSLVTAAEIILLKLPDDRDWNNSPVNPPFFGEKLGIATFSYCDNRPLIRELLKNIIENDPFSFEDSIPF
ncbi:MULTISPECIES: hypothetical protein [Xenorhabdus]|uniref:Uncharacterized protein n=2 Tax=Xenorhabdus TaxID=626 RepID=A0A0B6X9C1_XENBV|nr:MULTISPECIES: hypothetical protein [Xenorhabdus]MDC9623828.1 hypothetical protein [Xenorhabdus aichiensis]CDM90180.1 protein of unknown function [Xenorhabdus bovienii]